MSVLYNYSNMKPSIPKGTRDFGPLEVQKRNYIFDIIKREFQLFGFVPIETPAMESLATLTGKYGEEGDRLLFKILNNGDFLAEADQQLLNEKQSSRLISQISKRGLRYDLTVPFARFVVMHRNDLTFPFKRYQIQPVWRADRPQKGRYQEFYQCDADVVGSKSLIYEAELVQIYDKVFHSLGMDVEIKINNRKILSGLAEVAGISDRFIDMTTAIDKIDKIGIEGTKKEMTDRGINEEAASLILNLLNKSDLAELSDIFAGSEIGRLGVAELNSVMSYIRQTNIHNTVTFDMSLARGLGYYTGCIFEVKALNVEMGSIGGGGRYDDLTGVFGMEGYSGVGISFGAERIFDVMESLNLFPETANQQTKVLVIGMDEAALSKAFETAGLLRNAGISCEIYPDIQKFKKTMGYANDKKMPYVLIIGDEELRTEKYTLKKMSDGSQQNIDIQSIISLILT